MNITIKPDKKYTALEVSKEILEVLASMGPRLSSNEMEFSPADLYWIITDVLRYVNKIMDGEFRLRSMKKNTWELIYVEEKAAKRKAQKKAQKDMKKAAKYIKATTGKFPKWSEGENS